MPGAIQDVGHTVVNKTVKNDCPCGIYVVMGDDRQAK